MASKEATDQLNYALQIITNHCLNHGSYSSLTVTSSDLESPRSLAVMHNYSATGVSPETGVGVDTAFSPFTVHLSVVREAR